MLKRIDHVVVAVRDVAAAISDYATVGLRATYGGVHGDGRTENALVCFADGTYVELVAFRDHPGVAGHRWWPPLQRGEGFVDYCLEASDLDAERERLTGAGLAVSGPTPGARDRPDGRRLEWRTLQVGAGATESALPFLIEDRTPRADRAPGTAPTDHPLGVSGIAALRLVARDVVAARGALGRTLGRSASSPDESTFAVGAQRLHLLHERAERDGIRELVLHSTRARGGRLTLDDPLLHGARVVVAARD